MRFRIIYILLQISFSWGIALGRFSQCFFVFFFNFSTLASDGSRRFYSASPFHDHHHHPKKAFYGPETKKTSFSNKSIENADFYKPALNKIMTTHE